MIKNENVCYDIYNGPPKAVNILSAKHLQTSLFWKTVLRPLLVCLFIRLSSVSYIQQYQSQQKISVETTEYYFYSCRNQQM